MPWLQRNPGAGGTRNRPPSTVHNPAAFPRQGYRRGHMRSDWAACGGRETRGDLAGVLEFRLDAVHDAARVAFYCQKFVIAGNAHVDGRVLLPEVQDHLPAGVVQRGIQADIAQGVPGKGAVRRAVM
ncbi:hypothetical protein G6F68_017236 [Rhizopus microsporus]|nr:hypothetical protein G6F68_017236 [Rhizopus microsporus]